MQKRTARVSRIRKLHHAFGALGGPQTGRSAQNARAPQLVLAAPTQSWEWVPPCRSLVRRSQVRKTAQAFSASSDDFLRSILPTNRPRSRGDGRGALWAMYDLVPDSTFSFKRGGEKSSKKCASRPLCATTDSTGHASRCIVRSGVQRGGHPGPYGPIATISDPGPFPGEGKGLIIRFSSARLEHA